MQTNRAPKPALHHAKPLPVDRLIRPFQEFAKFSSAGGIVLLFTAIAAFVIANSPLAAAYHGLFYEHEIALTIGGWRFVLPNLELFINDAMMAIFFLLVGMEIKREMLVGELAGFRKASLPVAAAAGGMIAPAAIYVSINWNSGAVHGWGVPVATDIAFALGVLMLLGKRIPTPLKVFLTSLAIADDLGALLVIAIFYTHDLNVEALRTAGLLVALLVAINWLGVRKTLPYLIIGLPLWYFIFQSGVHATIAGVLLAMTIPARERVDPDAFIESNRNSMDMFEQATRQEASVRKNPDLLAAARTIELNCEHIEPPLYRLEHKLAGLVAFFIIPVFALANAGVHVGSLDEFSSPITLGVMLGLVFGKPIGVMAASFLAVKLRLADLPRGVTWKHLHGAAWLAGIGFTMSLFIANLAFAGSVEFLDEAKLGILSASGIASAIGLTVLLISYRKPAQTELADATAHETGHAVETDDEDSHAEYAA